jgi:hypothetical protein
MGSSKSILHAVQENSAPLNAVFNVIKGNPEFVLSGHHRRESPFCFLVLSWRVTDIDIHSETLRFLGEVRLTIYGVYDALARRMYHGGKLLEFKTKKKQKKKLFSFLEMSISLEMYESC